MLTKDGSEFAVFYLKEEKPMVVDDAGCDVSTGEYVAGGFLNPPDPLGYSAGYFSEMTSNYGKNLGLAGPIGAKGHTGWKGEQEAYAGEMVLPEDMVMGRLYKVEGIDTVARFMGEYNDLLFKMKHHDTWFYVPMDAKVRKIGKSEVDEYLS